MRQLHPLLILSLALVALLTPVRVRAEDITVQASPDHIAASPGATAQIDVDVDITAPDPDDRILSFEVKVSQGTVTPSTFEMRRTADGGRTARGRQTLTYT